MLAVARERAGILAERGEKKFTIYGENISGGPGVIYLLPDSPEVYGFPEKPKAPPAVNFVNVFSNSFVSLIAAFLIAIGAYVSFKKED